MLMRQKEGCLFEKMVKKKQMDIFLVLRKHRPEREAVLELRTKFAAAKDLITTLIYILTSLYIIREVDSVKYCKAKTKHLIFVAKRRPDISFLVELAVFHCFRIGTCILSR